MPEGKIVKGEIVDGKLYTFGGNTTMLKKAIHQFDLKTEKWEKVGELPQPLSEFTTTVYKDKIILIGGGKIQNNIIQVFNTKTNGIFQVKTNLPSKNSGVVVVEDKLYVFGGKENGSVKDDLWVLDLREIRLFHM